MDFPSGILYGERAGLRKQGSIFFSPTKLEFRPDDLNLLNVVNSQLSEKCCNMADDNSTSLHAYIIKSVFPS